MRSHNVKQANRQSINITFAQPKQRRRPSQLKQLGRQLQVAAEELDTVKDRAAASGYRFTPKIPDIDATSAAGAKRLIAQVQAATARGRRLVSVQRQGRHGIVRGEALPRRVDEEGFLADPIPRTLVAGDAEWAEEAQAPALQAGVGDAEWAEEAQAPALRAAEGDAEWAEDNSELEAMTDAARHLGGELASMRSPALEAGTGGVESAAEDNSELEQTREHVRELLGMAQELVSASESSPTNQDLEDVQADVSELMKIAIHMSTGHTAALVPGSSSESFPESRPPQLEASSSGESAPVVQDPEIVKMLAEMRELEGVVEAMAGMVAAGQRHEAGTMGETPLAESPVGVLQFGDQVLVLPDVSQSNSSRDFKEDARQFLAIRRKINGESVTPAESRLMIHTLERYRQSIRHKLKEANVTSKDFLRRLDRNVVDTIVALGG